MPRAALVGSGLSTIFFSLEGFKDEMRRGHVASGGLEYDTYFDTKSAGECVDIFVVTRVDGEYSMN